MLLFNSLTKKKETFKPQEGSVVTMYSCGPTVYASATIGNLRAYLFTDVLKKTLKLHGFLLRDVINITDVGHLQSDADDGDDKMEVAAKKQKTTPEQIAARYTDEFFADCALLNIDLSTTKIAKATDYVPHMIEHIRGLELGGFTYLTSDGVYFDSAKFPNYYALSGKKGDGDKAGVRVSLGEKKNPNDFALWKFTPPTALQKWDSPWGVGCPGWHIECSAIIRAELGDTIDIHTGGVDHIHIHHTNEIAQTEALTNKPFVRFWMHNEFVKVNNTKMSKSLGNAYTLGDLVARGFNPMAFRYFVLGAHYKTILNFTWEALEGAQRAYNNLVKRLSKLTGDEASPLHREKFIEFLADDLNTPKALALLWEVEDYNQAIEFDKVLGLGLREAVEEFSTKTQDVAPQDVVALAEQRHTAKQAKDWVASDKIREQVRGLGWEIIDKKDGFALVKKP